MIPKTGILHDNVVFFLALVKIYTLKKCQFIELITNNLPGEETMARTGGDNGED